MGSRRVGVAYDNTLVCGIAGILGKVNDANRAALKRMSGCMAHRGPNSEGLWESAAGDGEFGCLMAHRRLSILDLSSGANQPMTDPVSGQTIVFNGEIYNYVSLREELQARGQKFESTGDTAVMLRLLSLEGARSVARLRGMFAYGLWDQEARRLTLARDPLGIKPLYICRNPDRGGDWSLLFASEVRAIMGSGLIGRPKLDPDAVASVVWNGFVMGPGTIVRGIETLMPGELRIYDPQGQQHAEVRYWELTPGDSPAIAPAQLRDTIRESVKLHLASDVPLGVFLSSGVDSSAVANLAQQASAKINGGPIHTFTLVFEEKELSEGEYAEPHRHRDRDGIHREITLTESAFVQNIDTAMDTLDQPTFDGLNSFYMSKAVREAGLTVALVGTGGDELFGGYTSFRDLPYLAQWAARTRFMPRGAKVAAAKAMAFAMQKGNTGGAMPAQTRWAKLASMVGSGEDLIQLYQLAYALFLPDYPSRIAGQRIDERVDGRWIAEIDARATFARNRRIVRRCSRPLGY